MSRAVKATEFRDEWVKVRVTILMMRQTVSDIQTILMVQCALRAEVKFSRKCKWYYVPLTTCLEQANDDDQIIHTPYNLATLCY